MAQYRKRPVVIDAVLYDGNLVGEPSAADPRKVEPRTCPDWFPAFSQIVGATEAEIDAVKVGAWFYRAGEKGLFLKTLEGVMEASPGDWIIRGVKGELYPCKPDIFRITYERPTTTTAWVNIEPPRPTAPGVRVAAPIALGRTAYWAKEDAVNAAGEGSIGCIAVEVPDKLMEA